MTANKNVSWTKESAEKLIKAYGRGETPLVELAHMFGRTEQSIRAKLVALGVYVAQPKAKAKASTVNEEVVRAISILTGLKGLESLAKADAKALESLAQWLVNKH